MSINHEIIIKYLQQTANNDEQQMLQQWLIEKPSHQAYFDEIESVWTNADFEIAESDFNIDQAWSRFSSKNPITATSKVIPMWEQSWIQIAASVILVMGVGLGAFYFLPETNSGTTAMVEMTSANTSKEVQLPDGSLVTLMPYSSIGYVGDFMDSREVTLTGGAYFNVQKRNDQAFEVIADNLDVTVLGTKFLVKDSDGLTEVFVEEGIVSVSNDFSDDKDILKANEGIYLDNASGKIEPIAALDNILSWKSGVLEFNNVQMTDVLKDIGRHYNVAIKLKNSDIGNCHVTSKFDNKRIEEVLEVLEIVLNLEIRHISSNEYLISGKGC